MSHLPDGWTPHQPPRQGRRLTRGSTSRDYALTLFLPDLPPPPDGYAALVVLDGDLHGPILAGTAQALARRTAKTGVGPTVVLGVSPADPTRGARERDYTFAPPALAGVFEGATGDGPALLDSLADDILPALHAAAPIDATRLGLFGHSLGAMFVLEALAARPRLFRAWIAISPSLWWRPDVASSASNGHPVFLAVGGEESNPGAPRDMVGPLRALAKTMDAPARLLAGEDHGSAPVAAAPAALRFLHGTDRG